MIRPLRQRHRRMFTVLGILLPVLFAVGIASRNAAPSVDSLPAGLAAAPERFVDPLWERDDLFEQVPIQVRLARDATDAGNFGVQLVAKKDFLKPDLIVYWVTEPPASVETLPDEAVLLGQFDSSVALPLPADAAATGGVLVLHSLADNETVAVSQQLRFGLSTK